LHRNLTELEDKHSISVINAGASFSGSVASLRFSSNVVFKKQDPPLDAESRVDRIFIPSGLNQWFYSINHLWIYHNVTLSGEWAIDKMFHLACIEHCLIGIGKKSELLLSFRHFHPGFYSNQSNTISANVLSWNEKGFYLAANTQIFRKLQFHGSIDFTGHPWLRYAEDDIRSQQEYGLRLQYTERRKWLIYFQYSHKNKEESRADPEKINENIIYLRQSDQFRLHLEMKLNSNWTWRSRIQIQKANLESNNRDAVLISQDFLYKSIESHFSANFRLALFDIPDYDLRIYSYENDLLNQFSLPAYNGRGIRLYANLRYKFSSALLLETKLATSYIYPDAISNIPDVMNESSYKTEIKIQMQFRF
jgi:hypothetical protein